MSVRVVGILAILAGASWTGLVLLFLAIGESAWAGSTGPLMYVLYIGGALALELATLGLFWRFQELLRPAATFGAVAVMIGAVVPFPENPLSVLLPAGSVLLMWDLARIGVLPRWAAIIHAVSGLGLLAGSIGILIGQPALGILFALAIPYLPSWIAIGASLVLRSAPRTIQPAAST